MFDYFEIIHSLPAGYFYTFSLFGSRNVTLLSISAIMAAKARFKLINCALEDRSSLNFDELKCLIVLQDKLCDSILLVSKSFSVIYIMQIFRFTVFSVFIMFDFFLITTKNSNFSHKIFLIAGLLFIIPAGITTISAIVQSALLKREGGKFLTLLHGKKISKGDKKTLNLIQLGSLQMAHQFSEISCGLFTIDWKFLFVLISTCFSYMIILCQFDVAETY